jgi:hypothetical protein
MTMRMETVAAWCVACGLLVAVSGCDSGTKQGAKKIEKGGAKVADTTAHAHEHEHGPHNGHLIELGEEEYHAEVVYDAAAKKIVVYILGSDPHKAHPIDQKEIALNLMIDGKPLQTQATAAPQQGEPTGQSSRFELAGNKDVAAHVHDLEELKGRLTVTIGGKRIRDLSHDRS